MIPFLTAYGGWVMDAEGRPALDNEATVKALEFFRALRDEHEVIPKEMDYQLMDTLMVDTPVSLCSPTAAPYSRPVPWAAVPSSAG